MCRFTYVVRREKWANALDSRVVLLSMTWFLVLSILSGTALVFFYMQPVMQQATGYSPAVFCYTTLQWLPPWWEPLSAGAPHQLALDSLVAACAAWGLVGFALAARARLRLDPQAFWNHAVPSLFFSFCTSGTPILRFLLLGGLAVGGIAVFSEVRHTAKRLLFHFGERIMDVS